MFRPIRFLPIMLVVAAGIVPAAALAATSGGSTARSFNTITVSPLVPNSNAIYGGELAGRPIKVHADVRIGDLDLATRAGRKNLRERVAAAAVDVCNRLDMAYPAGTPLAEDQCRGNAMDSAQPAVRAAIAHAEHV